MAEEHPVNLPRRERGAEDGEREQVPVRWWVIWLVPIWLTAILVGVLSGAVVGGPSTWDWSLVIDLLTGAGGLSVFVLALRTYQVALRREESRRTDAIEAINHWTDVTETFTNGFFRRLEDANRELIEQLRVADVARTELAELRDQRMEQSQQSRQEEWQRRTLERDRKRRSQEILEYFNQLDRVQVRSFLEGVERKGMSDDDVKAAVEEDVELRDRVTALLGQLEDMSVMIFQRLCDEQLLYESLVLIVTQSYFKLDGYIRIKRQDLRDDRLYADLERLALAWRDCESVLDGRNLEDQSKELRARGRGENSPE